MATSQLKALNFEYDDLHRIGKADYGNGTIIEYSYDPAGNQVSRVVSDNRCTLAATVDPPNAGTVTGAGATLVGNPASLSATPASGFVFHHWSEGSVSVGTNSTLTFTVLASRNLVANFVPATAIGAWRLANYGTIANTGDAADTATPQHDGITNLMKFATGIDPTNPGTNPGTSTVDANNFTFTYTRNKSAVSDGVSFIVEWSDDLAPAGWSTSGVTVTVLDQGSTELVTASIPKGSNGRRFVHLRVNGQVAASTEPVGFNTITALGNSDTRYSVPFHRAAVFQGTVQSVSANVITVQGTSGWTANQFVYSAGNQPNVYYVEFGSGGKEGMSYVVTGNGVGSISINLNGDVLQGVVTTGHTLRVIPFWSLATLFPYQAGITGTSSISGAGSMTRIFVPDVSTAGTNLAASSSYYYYTGTGFGGPGWRKQGGGFTNKKDDDTLPPELYLIIRQDGVATNVVQTGGGTVPLTIAGATHRMFILDTLRANTPQDNAVALDIPLPLSLAASNLYTGQTGAFVGTSSISGSSGDKLFFFDDAAAAINKAASKSYYYYTGSAFGGAGWRLQGGGFTTIRDNELVFKPGSGVIIRKEATASPSSFIWNIPLAY